jgi:hypothetical protein
VVGTSGAGEGVIGLSHSAHAVGMRAGNDKGEASLPRHHRRSRLRAHADRPSNDRLPYASNDEPPRR